jgi:NAD(P)H dehydrogenase (quinone)
MKLLVTGATGQFGKTVVETLLGQGLAGQMAVSVRDPAKASSYAGRGVEVRQGDFDDPASLGRAFAGVERLLLVSTSGDIATRIRQHKIALQAARAAGVGFIAYTSLANASHNSLDLAEVHRATEEAIRATGIPYAFLRNNWYLENELGFVQAALAGAPIRNSAGQGKVGWALRADFARAAAAVLAGSGHANKIYELSGLLATYSDIAAALSQATGRKVVFEPVDDAVYAADLTRAGLPEFLAQMYVGFAREIRQGALAVESGDFQKLLGHPATPLAEALGQLANQMQSQAN